LKPNPGWAALPLFDCTGWKRVRFDDVVEISKAPERDPEAAGIKRFIAMEHLEPGSLHVCTWRDVAEGTTFFGGGSKAERGHYRVCARSSLALRCSVPACQADERRKIAGLALLLHKQGLPSYPFG